MLLVVLMVAGALAAVAGTRVAAVPLLLAAASGVVIVGGLPAAVLAFGAALAAWVVLVADPRSVALPAIGMTAVAVAAASPNAAAVLPAWMVSVVCVVVGARTSGAGRRWLVGVLTADALVAVAVSWSALAHGFEDWPGGMASAAAVLVAVGAVLKATLAWDADDHLGGPGLLVVRVQAAVLAVLAASSGGLAARVLVVGAALALAGATLARAQRVRDGVQDSAAVCALIAMTGLGWLPSSAVWVGLAGGTILHLARVSGSSVDAVTGFVYRLVGSGGLGGALLPALIMIAGTAVSRGGPVSALVLGAVVVAVAGRWWRPDTAGGWQLGPAATPVGVGALALALLGPWMTGLAGVDMPWPPPWAMAAVVAAGVAGAAIPRAMAPEHTTTLRHAPRPPDTGSRLDTFGGGVARRVDQIATPGAVISVAAGLSVVAVGLWLVGWIRGFL